MMANDISRFYISRVTHVHTPNQYGAKINTSAHAAMIQNRASIHTVS